ncbi:PREDICTED: uncharacterized protein LOC105978048 [Erythranthe guttata]|uniref:uncharacterized protein LOC105978048 n=1 Tax=Erythranthe guttata TaxID=4155 RepID=UPI00064D9A9B|nr:PREDICTED: uncharacterized protein LOC105978048 [Erythranthe guttata]|eukprot:XP_012858912.1 PREDICTED: uncharacterized protein LOC105978048 [Erythranthe guttata]
MCLLPEAGTRPKFAQLYIFDKENEIQNKIDAVRSGNNFNNLDPYNVASLRDIIDGNNVLAQSYRAVRDRPEDRPDLLCGVFKMKLDIMMTEIKKVVYSDILEHKRGLPHEHILLWLNNDDKPKNPEYIDRIICAEIPDEETDRKIYHALSEMQMVILFTREGNMLLNQNKSIKYMFKYVNKGQDRVTAEFYETRNTDGDAEIRDEIKMYYDCRYLSACEAMWRLFTYDIHYRDPSEIRLSFHLPDHQPLVFNENLSL